MAKRYERLISKSAAKQLKSVAPWAIAVAAFSGMVAALADRRGRGRSKPDSIAEVRSEEKSVLDGISAGFSVPQASGAV